jgi:hypothetical protein
MTITVKELREALAALPDSHEVKVWLPGSYISLERPFLNKDRVLIEGNLDDGSALELDHETAWNEREDARANYRNDSRKHGD